MTFLTIKEVFFKNSDHQKFSVHTANCRLHFNCCSPKQQTTENANHSHFNKFCNIRKLINRFGPNELENKCYNLEE